MSQNGQLTEAQTLLLQRFPHLPEDDPLVELAAWNAVLEQKVDNFGVSLNTWTQAILKQIDLANSQNQLIASQNLTLQQTGKTNESLGQTLVQWRQDFSELQKDYNLLKSAILKQGDTLQSLSNQSNSLSKKLEDLSVKLGSLESLTKLNTKVESLSDSIKTLNNSVSLLSKNFEAGAVWLFGIMVFLFLLQFGQMIFFNTNLGRLNDAVLNVQQSTGWIMDKLERLEKG